MSMLPDRVLRAIAPLLQEISFNAGEIIVVSDEQIDRLYILQEGQVEIQGKTENYCLLTGSIVNLKEILLQQPAKNTVKTLTQAKFLYLGTDKFRDLIQQYPEVSQIFSQQLAQEIDELSSQLIFEQERQSILRPYLITKAKRGIIGKSRYAVRLRQDVKKATDDQGSVLIFGEPGLEKDNLAALIHYSSSTRREAIIKVDCGTLQASGSELFGREGGKLGLIEALGKGTLILNNIQDLPSELLNPVVQLLKTQTYISVNRSSTPPAQKICQARLILISEKTISPINSLVSHLIKVPPLRVRKSDLADQINYYISIISRRKRINKPHITPEALRKLQGYDFPNNLRELQNLTERAIVQLSGESELTEEIIWPSKSKKQQFRLNLLNAYPRLRYFLRSAWWPDRINYGITLTAFPIIIAILFFGPQTRDQNFALNLFWAWWWPLILIGFPFVGRLWCSVCPFMIYGEVTQKLSVWLFPNHQLKSWPRETAEKWGGWFLFGLFTLILLWEELWELPNTAYLSACLLLLITAGAMICSAIFERRFWCRYLCPIGGMNGMFAKLSMTELRAQQGTCSAECTTYQCYKGGPQKGEGLETNGCPLYSHPAQLQDNRDCVLCMTCLKACPHRSVKLNLRPPGIELWTTHQPRLYEVALLFLLLDTVFLHKLPEINTILSLGLDLTNFWIHLSFSIVILSLPVILPLMGYGIIKLAFYWNKKTLCRSFVELAYGYLPLALMANLAYYLPLGLGEGGRILPLTMATFGLNGGNLPIFVAHPAVITFLQGVSLIFGVICAIILSQKISRQSFRSFIPQHLSIIGLGILFWWIV
ncbi:sigma 54-interacting transcriptional regulator [Geminocystis sp. NIES-3709]|uniref:sigma 54-interacting transcriptional regulator n=1 Tax=Geminocystis sp. NIES-3709 TaxID=1617448 RepID=UPI0005FCC76A|nr:sigma 54-interacting transcriptional regulator [Geminocystis sp. NIES-3709]BAQ64684.1 transcriptional regulatory protein tyrR [Geminocystis sp. NIES-3709]